MCGIAGIYKTDGSALPADALHAVKAMTDKMISRGPDGEGQWLDGPVCLGHRRLSIIDLAGGLQPMLGAAGNLAIVFNGEIYNFASLRRELEKDGMVFKTYSDTEVLLASYARYGIACLERIEGMFAFVIYDKVRKRIFAARDHFGKKPFYYSIQNGMFAFASDLGSLTTLENSFASFSFHVAPDSLMRYLAYEYVPTPQSIYGEVKVLEPAHYLLLDNGNLELAPYWELPFPEKALRTDETALCEELRGLMSNAVRMRMVSDVPLGVFLSGGIDSSIVAGLMAEQSDRPIKTFSIGFSEASYDESSYARIVAEAFHTDHHERILSARECADELPGIVSSMDTPMADASCAPTWLLSGLAREKVTVALGGDGADELWAGYEHYIGFRIAQWYNKIPQWLRKKVIVSLVNNLPESAGYINPRLAVQTFLKGADSPDWLRVQTMLTAIGPQEQREILSDEFLAAHGNFLERDKLFEPTKWHYEHWRDDSRIAPLARAFHVYVRQFLLDDILVKVDRCSMLHSLEVRAPFLDKRVAEFVSRLPLSCKLRGFKRKYLLKKAFSRLLPPQILKRNKRGFQIPVAQWLRSNMKPLLLDLLGEEYLKSQGIFNPHAVAKMLNAHFSEKQDFRKPLWTLLVLQLWLKANNARTR